jgi:SAM-dependent methyltransferase
MPGPSYEPAHCLICGHAESRIVADEAAIRTQVETLWAFHQRRLKSRTPVERLRDRVAFSQHPPFRLVACDDCGLVYRNPVERGFELESVYARDCPPVDLLRALHEAQRPAYRDQARRLARMLPPGASILEVGSYVGAFLVNAREAGLRPEGVDINPAVNAFSRALRFRVHDGPLTAVDDRRFDAIAIWNTFDQLEEPRAAVYAARERLVPGGVLAIRVPNGEFVRRWTARFPSVVATAMLAHNNLLTFPYRWGFTIPSLSKLLAEAGFVIDRVVGDVLVPVADEWTRPWARFEERLFKGALKRLARRPRAAPWIEVYATAPAAKS